MAEEQRRDRQDQEQEQEDEQQQQRDDKEQDKGGSPQSPPSKVARLSSDESDVAGDVTTAVASPLALGPWLGLGAAGEEAAKPGFTFMQMQEFHHQALIFKHIVAGIPVPIHLILPIWKSVAASYGPHHYPSFVGLGNLCYDFRNSMEPEPGRCRRTDGKKWRCSRDVVPDQKYCQQHMHRGRNRSRKPVEGATGVTVGTSLAPPTTAITNNLLITMPDDDCPANTTAAAAAATTTTNSTSTSNITINSSNGVSTARVGSSPTSVLSSSTACKSGGS